MNNFDIEIFHIFHMNELRIIDNVDTSPPNKRISRLYWSILNNTILKSITEYVEYETLTCPDRICHHGSNEILVTHRRASAIKNTAMALKLLKEYIPYSVAKRLVDNHYASGERITILYRAITDFKLLCADNFDTLFVLDKK